MSIAIKQVHHQAGAGQDLATLPEAFIEAIYDRLNDYIGQTHPIGQHSNYFVIDGVVVRVNAFIDTDGTLWVQRLTADRTR